MTDAPAPSAPRPRAAAPRQLPRRARVARAVAVRRHRRRGHRGDGGIARHHGRPRLVGLGRRAGIASQSRALRSRLTALGEEDATAFAQVLVTMRDRTGTPEQRDFALGLALLRAAEVPLRIAEAAADVAELAAAAAAEGSPHLQPDATAAAALAEAATQAATHLVEINLAIVPGDRHSERAALLGRRSGRGAGARAGSDVSERMIPAWSLTAEAAGSIGDPGRVARPGHERLGDRRSDRRGRRRLHPRQRRRRRPSARRRARERGRGDARRRGDDDRARHESATSAVTAPPAPGSSARWRRPAGSTASACSARATPAAPI